MPTPYPFQSGATLLASQMNSLSQLPTVSITANSTAVATHAYSRVIANGSAITYTIPNNVFEAGQVIEFHNINSTVATIAAGAGVTLNGAAGLTVAQYQSATIYATSASSFILFESDVTQASSGLVKITGPTTFTSVTSIAFPNDTFTSTYRFYKVLLAIRGDSTASDLTLQFRNNSGAQNAAHYYSAVTGLIYTGTGADSTTNAGTSAAIGSTGVNGGSYDITVAEPADANRWGTVLLTSFGNDRGRSGGLLYAQQVASTGLVITGTTNVSGSYTVYGMAES